MGKVLNLCEVVYGGLDHGLLARAVLHQLPAQGTHTHTGHITIR